MGDLTEIIPIFRDKLNIGTIIAEVEAVFSRNTIKGEILVEDDSSPDGAIGIVRDLKKT